MTRVMMPWLTGVVWKPASIDLGRLWWCMHIGWRPEPIAYQYQGLKPKRRAQTHNSGDEAQPLASQGLSPTITPAPTTPQASSVPGCRPTDTVTPLTTHSRPLQGPGHVCDNIASITTIQSLQTPSTTLKSTCTKVVAKRLLRLLPRASSLFLFFLEQNVFATHI